MSSRDEILRKVKANKPAATPLPQNITFQAPLPENRLPLFTKSFSAAGGVVVPVTSFSEIDEYLQLTFPEPTKILNTVPGITIGHTIQEDIEKGHGLKLQEIAIVAGDLAVAENGAIWVSEDKLPIRVVPFICEHIALVISQSSIVGIMQEAYAQLQVNKPGYGVFIAGPSRTADIEQSLVIGAHGPKRAHVFILLNQ